MADHPSALPNGAVGFFLGSAMSHPDPTARIYDQLAKEYDERWRFYEQVTLDAALEALSVLGTERVLDVGCGTGELERRLLARCPGLSIVGADLSMGMLLQAARKNLGRQVRWLIATSHGLPFATASFDWVVCASSFHYFRHPHQALHEMHRVLRPGGRLVLVDWCDDYWTCKLCSWWLRWTDPAFYRTYTLRACRMMLQRAHWEVLSERRFRVGRLWGLMCFTARRPAILPT